MNKMMMSVAAISLLAGCGGSGSDDEDKQQIIVDQEGAVEIPSRNFLIEEQDKLLKSVDTDASLHFFTNGNRTENPDDAYLKVFFGTQEEVDENNIHSSQKYAFSGSTKIFNDVAYVYGTSIQYGTESIYFQEERPIFIYACKQDLLSQFDSDETEVSPAKFVQIQVKSYASGDECIIENQLTIDGAYIVNDLINVKNGVVTSVEEQLTGYIFNQE